jgi:lysozyme
MTLNQKGKDLIIRFEGLKLEAYLCPANKWTIGVGSTFYEDNSLVEDGDKITRERALKLFDNIADKFSVDVRKLITKPLTTNQFSALVSFAFNCGLGNFKSSTLLRKVNANPNDPTIAAEFAKWDKAGRKVLRGLTIRRKAESDLYFEK